MISIILPVYNCEDSLKKCLDSLISQSYSDFEVICIDDGSKDKSGLILNEYAKKDKRFKVFHQDNHGVSYARNKAISYAKGEYITFLDSDDFLENDALKIMFSYMNKYKVDMVRTNYFKILNNKKNKGYSNYKKEEILNSKEIISDLIPKVLSGEVRSYLVIICIKKDIIVNNKIHFDNCVSMMEDKIFFIELLMSVKNFIQVKDYTYNYVLNENSAIMSKEKCNSRIKNIFDVSIILKKILKEKNILDKQNMEKLIISHFEMLCRELIYCDDTKETINYVYSFKKNAFYSDIFSSFNHNKLRIDRFFMFILLKKHMKNILYFYIKILKRIKNIKKRRKI